MERATAQAWSALVADPLAGEGILIRRAIFRSACGRGEIDVLGIGADDGARLRP